MDNVRDTFPKTDVSEFNKVIWICMSQWELEIIFRKPNPIMLHQNAQNASYFFLFLISSIFSASAAREIYFQPDRAAAQKTPFTRNCQDQWWSTTTWRMVTFQCKFVEISLHHSQFHLETYGCRLLWVFNTTKMWACDVHLPQRENTTKCELRKNSERDSLH